MPDRDEEAIKQAQATLKRLRRAYWDAKEAEPPVKFDDLYDLRCAYEEAVVEYAGLEGRLLHDDILTSVGDLAKLQKIRERMDAAVDLKETILAARDFIKLIVAIV
ncbi:MAG TPA: hypothetical protein VI229_04120 [Burkholderiales bacterium]